MSSLGFLDQSVDWKRATKPEKTSRVLERKAFSESSFGTLKDPRK